MKQPRSVFWTPQLVRKWLLAYLRGSRLFSRTTPELDSIDLWLVHRPKYFVGIVMSAPIVLCFSALRHLVLIRFGVFHQAERIGYFVPAIAYFSLASSRSTKRFRTVDFISIARPFSNSQCVAMLKRQVRIISAPWLWLFLERACLFWTRSEVHRVPVSPKLEQYSQFLGNPGMLTLTAAETQKGAQLLEALGIPVGSAWVCIHNRDSKYLATSVRSLKFAPGASWAYHSYRDFAVKTLALASEELAERGFYVLRMGAVVEEPLFSTNPKIIDYASAPLRGDFADIYLMANCTAYLGSDAGIFLVPLTYGKPTVIVNFSLAKINEMTYLTIDPFITKHLRHRETQRFLGLREMFGRGLLTTSHSRIFEEAGVEAISNTPEEIRDLAVEMDERIKGSWEPAAEDERLQTRFWEIFRQYCPSDLIGGVQARIGSAFLRQNRYLLD